MNNVLTKIIRNNVFRKNIEGEIMYNYKFDNSILDEIVSKCGDSIKNDETKSLIGLLSKCKNTLYFDNNICRSEKDKQSNLQNSLGFNKLIVNNMDAFESDELDSYKEIDDKYFNLVSALNFELKILEGNKAYSMQCFDFNDVIKVAKKIESIKIQLSRIQQELNNFNNDIASREGSYLNNMNQFVEELKNSKSKNEEYYSTKYGSRLIDNYKYSLMLEVLNNFFKEKSRDEILYFLSSDKVKELLGDKYENVLNRFTEDVGRSV